MTVPIVPFEGRMSYCLMKSLQMVLAYKGHPYPVGWLECVGGEAFDFVYVRDENRLFAIIGDYYHLGGEQMLRTLNFPYTYTSSSDDKAAVAALQAALQNGPVAVGMLDMGYLTYMPNHEMMRGVDHAVVVLAMHSDSLIVHDPDGYPAVSISLSDFLEAWKRDIYTGKPYGLWQIGKQGTPPTDDMIWEKTITHARSLLSRKTGKGIDGATLVYGPEGMHQLAADLTAHPERDLGGLPWFNWRVSGQRCMDSAFFLRERLPQAANIRWEECVIYGQIQRVSAANDRKSLSDLLNQLADCEAKFIAALG